MGAHVGTHPVHFFFFFNFWVEDNWCPLCNTHTHTYWHSRAYDLMKQPATLYKINIHTCLAWLHNLSMRNYIIALKWFEIFFFLNKISNLSIINRKCPEINLSINGLIRFELGLINA